MRTTAPHGSDQELPPASERALETAQLAGHELNNKLLLVTGYGELLAERLAGTEHAAVVRRMVEAAAAAGDVLHRLQSSIRDASTGAGA